MQARNEQPRGLAPGRNLWRGRFFDGSASFVASCRLCGCLVIVSRARGGELLDNPSAGQAGAVAHFLGRPIEACDFARTDGRRHRCYRVSQLWPSAGYAAHRLRPCAVRAITKGCLKIRRRAGAEGGWGS